MYTELFNSKEKDILSYIETNLKVRQTHILETRELSIQIAKHYNTNVEKSSLAALLHDIAKYLNSENMRKLIFEYDGTIYPKHYTGSLLHAKASTAIAYKDFSIDDKEILNAIERHTTGSTNMTITDKILYIADYLEPSRKLEIADKLREQVLTDFDYVFRECVIDKIKYVVETKRFVDNNSIDLYNSLILK